jgi:hypothetical protein
MIFKSFAALAALAPAASVSAQAVVPAVDYSTARPTPGSWAYQATPAGSSARFIDATGTARMVLECTKATRRVMISRTSATPAASIFVWTSSAARSLPARFEANAMRVTAELPAFDNLLDGIAFSRGRIAAVMPGAESLVMPAWPEAARTIEDCRI